MAKVKGVKIEGLEPLMRAFEGLPNEFKASVVRNIARKPAGRIVTLARRLFTPKDTGATKRTFAILPVKNLSQMFLEIGVKGRSLAWIFMKGATSRQKSSGAKTGTIEPLGMVHEQAAEQIGQRVTKEYTVDLNKIIVKYWKRHLRKRR